MRPGRRRVRSDVVAGQEERRVARRGRAEAAHELAERRDVGGVFQKRAPCDGWSGRLNAVPTGLTKTRSASSSSVFGLSPSIRRSARGPVLRPLHALRTEAAELLPRRGHARRAAQENDQRPRRRIGHAVLRVVGEEEWATAYPVVALRSGRYPARAV